MKELLQKKLAAYVADFNANDEECYRQAIGNEEALAWLSAQIPLLDCPDGLLEKIYYFRFWTLRKHVKRTEDGYVMTEFLPDVAWAGKHNTIIAPFSHHLAESKWLADRTVMDDYTDHFLTERGDPYSYSTPLLYAFYAYCVHHNDRAWATAHLDDMLRIYANLCEQHGLANGLFWSVDDRDAMEFSISGTTDDGVMQKGMRPTLNSYMAANAYAIARVAEWAGCEELVREYDRKHDEIRDQLNTTLWDGDFYRAVHGPDENNLPCVQETCPEQTVRELIGYIPFAYDLAPKGAEAAFKYLFDRSGFLCDVGFTTAEQSHPRFLYRVKHACTWNGYVWPYATSQVVDAMARTLKKEQNVLTKEHLYEAIHTYAKSHFLDLPDGRRVPWIDEAKHPFTDRWITRDILMNGDWRVCGGYERGKDYNHSTYCDMILSHLLGISFLDGEISVVPQIPDGWTHFAVANLQNGGRTYTVLYDRDGSHYGRGTGLQILCE